VGYCSQFDSFPRGATGREFVRMFLTLHGFSSKEADERVMYALERVSLTEAADRKVAGYSKGMRQRARLAQSIAHDPQVLVLDEPLNGLDPMARAETIRIFQALAAQGLYLIISSHILHEVDMMSDRVVLINNGYILAEGAVTGVRDEIEDQPMQILVRCDKPVALAARVFELNGVTEARMHPDRGGLFVKTRQPDEFYDLLNRAVVAGDVAVDIVQPVDDDLNAVYQYLIGTNPEGARG
jgi:ABC-2 type transport system ATP-binding protein